MHILTRIAIGSMLCLSWLVHGTIACAQSKFSTIHGASAAKYQQWIDGLFKQNLRPTFVSVAEINGEPTFAAIAIENVDKQSWAVSQHLTPDAYQQEFDAQRGKGLRPICVVGYRRGDAVNYAAIFLKDDPKFPWYARHGMDIKENQHAFDSLVKAGYRPVQGVGFVVDDEIRFAYLFVKDGVPNWISQSGLTRDQYQRLLSEHSKKNARLVSVSAYPTKFGIRFAAILAEDGMKLIYNTRDDLTPQQYQEYLNEMTGKGYRPAQICAYPLEKEVRYLAIFVKGDK